MTSKRVLDWLLEPSNPSIQYLTLTRLLGRRASDSEVRAAQRSLPSAGWVAEILARRDPAGWWAREKSLYTPKYLATNWNLLALSDLGATREIPEVRASAELWMARSPLRGGGVGGFSKGQGHLCYTGNMARALVRFGYGEDPRVRKTFEWLARTAHPQGGWSCWNFKDAPAPSRNLDSWEALSAFAVYPRSRWSRAMTECVELGAEYYLAHELHRQGARYPPWYRFHWPMHYYYDVLVGLEMLTALGYTEDPRLRFAVDLVKQKRRKDGRWNLDALHPDGPTSWESWFRSHPGQRMKSLGFEAVGRPSKMITLRALTVLARVDGTS